MTDKAESGLSYSVRRGTGLIAAASLVVAAVSALVGPQLVTITAPIVAALLPPIIMIGHLTVTRVLTRDEKALWRKELWWSHRYIVAVWAYMFAADLSERARRFLPYRKS